jgi:hypothetical protein
MGGARNGITLTGVGSFAGQEPQLTPRPPTDALTRQVAAADSAAVDHARHRLASRLPARALDAADQYFPVPDVNPWEGAVRPEPGADVLLLSPGRRAAVASAKVAIELRQFDRQCPRWAPFADDIATVTGADVVLKLLVADGDPQPAADRLVAAAATAGGGPVTGAGYLTGADRRFDPGRRPGPDPRFDLDDRFGVERLLGPECLVGAGQPAASDRPVSADRLVGPDRLVGRERKTDGWRRDGSDVLITVIDGAERFAVASTEPPDAEPEPELDTVLRAGDTLRLPRTMLHTAQPDAGGSALLSMKLRRVTDWALRHSAPSHLGFRDYPRSLREYRLCLRSHVPPTSAAGWDPATALLRTRIPGGVAVLGVRSSEVTFVAAGSVYRASRSVLRVLAGILAADGIRPADVADVTGVSPRTAGSAVEALLRWGLVRVDLVDLPVHT